MRELRTIRAGLVDYQAAWDWQNQLHSQRVSGEIEDTVLLLEHPPVYTAGKRTEAWERPIDGTPVIEVDRGGRITWHGPGQLVGYPIVALADPIDVMVYVRRLETALIRACASVGVTAVAIDGRTGVWVSEGAQEKKVAAIGVRVARGVTRHGFALNCNPDLEWFGRIVPCGITDAGVTSLTELLGREVSISELLPIVERELTDVLTAEGLDARAAS